MSEAITEELDFLYVLTLLQPLHGCDTFSWLPELFSIIGPDKLLQLSKFAGGEEIRIPTLDEIYHCIECVTYYYHSFLLKDISTSDIPVEYIDDVLKIAKIYAE